MVFRPCNILTNFNKRAGNSHFYMWIKFQKCASAFFFYMNLVFWMFNNTIKHALTKYQNVRYLNFPPKPSYVSTEVITSGAFFTLISVILKYKEYDRRTHTEVWNTCFTAVIVTCVTCKDLLYLLNHLTSAETKIIQR